jgi:hypothetical protein
MFFSLSYFHFYYHILDFYTNIRFNLYIWNGKDEYLAPFSSPLWSGVGGSPAGYCCFGGVAVLARGLNAVRADNIFPFEITYTEQKFGADLIKLPGTS